MSPDDRTQLAGAFGRFEVEGIGAGAYERSLTLLADVTARA